MLDVPAFRVRDGVMLNIIGKGELPPVSDSVLEPRLIVLVFTLLEAREAAVTL
jgi:hypothetical protein